MPVFGVSATGSITITVMSEVIKIGRRRSRQARAIAASRGSSGCSRRRRMIWSIKRMAVVMSMPVRIMTAMMDTLENA